MVVVVSPRGCLDDPELYASVGVLKDDEISLLGVEVFVEDVLEVLDGEDIVALLEVEDFLVVGVVVIIKGHFR